MHTGEILQAIWFKRNGVSLDKSRNAGKNETRAIRDAKNQLLWLTKSMEVRQKVFDQILKSVESHYGVEFVYYPEGAFFTTETEVNRTEISKVQVPPGYYYIKEGKLHSFEFPPPHIYETLV